MSRESRAASKLRVDRFEEQYRAIVSAHKLGLDKQIKRRTGYMLDDKGNYIVYGMVEGGTHVGTFNRLTLFIVWSDDYLIDNGKNDFEATWRRVIGDREFNC